MYKKFFAIMVIAAFLITSVGVISAADDSISVKIIWDDNGNDKPDSVTVNLIKDGAVVDSAKLSSDNGWKATFKVDDDGDYQVKELIGSDYFAKVYGNSENGFVIKNHFVNSDVLGIDDDSSLDEDGNTTSDNNLSDSDTPIMDQIL